MTSAVVRRFGRRRFLAATAAAACVGCGGDEGAPAGRAVGSTDPSATPSDGAPPVDSTPAPGGMAAAIFGPVDVGSVDEVRSAIADGPRYVPEARAWLTAVAESDRPALAESVDPSLRAGIEIGVLALFQKCPHLGCRVPFCESSGWFECPCHGAMFTALGEHRDGPGPRGLDRFVVVVDGDRVSIDTTALVSGAALGSDVVDDPPIGPHCVLAEHR